MTMLTRRRFLKSVVGAVLAISSGVLPQTTRRVEKRLPAWLGNSLKLRKEEWLQLDDIVLHATRQRLRAWADLNRAEAVERSLPLDLHPADLGPIGIFRAYTPSVANDGEYPPRTEALTMNNS